ncbi:MAG: glycosyltransferase [Mesorhizobium sp.]|nr:glycosyltransferase [Mesorhizobium sp.]
MTPFVTIVTATLNRRTLLERALASAAREGLDDVQHVVVDGGSSDGTLELLAAYPHLEIVCEPDRNLYDAWNKGIARARGDFILLLNSDDELAPGALAEARRMAALHPDADMISGAVSLAHGQDGASGETVIIDDPRMVELREQDVGPGVPLTNGRFLRRRFVNALGGFDVRYPVLADRQFFLRALIAGAVNVTTDKLIYRYHVHGGSLTLNDNAPAVAHAEEALRVTVDGMAEAASPAARAAYRRWHAWAAFYLAGLQSRQGRLSAALATSVSALGRDPLAPLRLVPQLIRHVAERRARQGRPQGDTPGQVFSTAGGPAIVAPASGGAIHGSPGQAGEVNRAGRIIGK